MDIYTTNLWSAAPQVTVNKFSFSYMDIKQYGPLFLCFATPFMTNIHCVTRAVTVAQAMDSVESYTDCENVDVGSILKLGNICYTLLLLWLRLHLSLTNQW